MSESSFYINDNEREDLFKYLTDLDVYLVPDKKYPNTNFEMVQTSGNLIERIQNETIGFFALSKHVSIYPLYLKQNEFILSEKAFFVVHKYGGPYFEFAFFTGFSEDSAIQYKRTWISKYPRYIKLEEVYEEFKPNNEFIELYNKVIKFIQLKCKKIKVNGKPYWVSKTVIDEIELKIQ